jgi:hypothetical protein
MEKVVIDVGKHSGRASEVMKSSADSFGGCSILLRSQGGKSGCNIENYRSLFVRK